MKPGRSATASDYSGGRVKAGRSASGLLGGTVVRKRSVWLAVYLQPNGSLNGTSESERQGVNQLRFQLQRAIFGQLEI